VGEGERYLHRFSDSRPTVEEEALIAGGKQALSPSQNNREHFSMKLKTFSKHLLIYFEGEVERVSVLKVISDISEI
jgi:hypothetical protein